MNGDTNEVVTENLGLVHACARRYIGRGIEYDDLYQAGCLGLIKAAKAFDYDRQVKFSTYAVPVILGEIKRLFRDGGAVKVSRSLKELGIKAARSAGEFEASHGREPKISELAEILGVDAETATEAVNAIRAPISLTSYTDSESGETLDIKEDSFDSSLVDLISVRQLLSSLDGRDKKLIYLRYYKGKTQSDTAAVLGMTQVQVSRREKAIITSIRNSMVG